MSCLTRQLSWSVGLKAWPDDSKAATLLIPRGLRVTLEIMFLSPRQLVLDLKVRYSQRERRNTM